MKHFFRENDNMTNREHLKEPLEIERKFLIRFPDLTLLEQQSSQKISIVQAYLISESNRSRRIRKQECGGKTQYWYNEKERISDLTRIEREREITEKEYKEYLQEMLPGTRTIRKTRYLLPSGKHCFEVDIFPEWKDRAFAEVELKEEEETFVFPDCLSVIKEVTSDGRYTNKSLAVHGFVYEEIENG